MNTKGFLWVVVAASLLASAISQAQTPRDALRDSAPTISPYNDVVLFAAPATENYRRMRVAVYDPADALILEAETEAPMLEWDGLGDLADGIYRYEVVAIIGTDGAEQVRRDTGRLKILNGRYVGEHTGAVRPEVFEGHDQAQIDEPDLLSRSIAGVLEWLVPAAQAQDLYSWSTAPSVFFDDTQDEDCTAGYDWFMRADGGFNNDDTNNTFTLFGYGENPPGQGCNNTIATILKIYHDGSTGLGSAAKSMIVEADGDIGFANDSMFLDRSHGMLTLEGETVSGGAGVRVKNASSNQGVVFGYDGTTAFLTGASSQRVISWHENAPADALSIDAAGTISFGNGFSLDSLYASSNDPRATLFNESVNQGVSFYFDGTWAGLENVTGGSVFRYHKNAPAGAIELASNGNVSVAQAVDASGLSVTDSSPALELKHSSSGHDVTMSFDGTNGALSGSSGQSVIRWHRNAPADALTISSTGAVAFNSGIQLNAVEVADGNPGVQLSHTGMNKNVSFYFDGNVAGLRNEFAQPVFSYHRSAPQNSLVIDSGGAVDFVGQLDAPGMQITAAQPWFRLNNSIAGNSVGFQYSGGTAGLTNVGGGQVINYHPSAPPNAISVDAAGNVSFLNPLPPPPPPPPPPPTESLELKSSVNGSSAYLTHNGSNFLLEGIFGGQDIVRTALSAPANSLVIDAAGRVGLGAASSGAALEVVRNDGTAAIEVRELSGATAPRTLFRLSNRGNTKFELDNVDAGVAWAFANSGNDFRISRQGSGQLEFKVDNAGNAVIAGTLTQNSDRNAKQNIQSLDYAQILDRVRDLPITQWEYIDTPGVPHIGPMAQDFYAAFGLGDTDTGISSVDTAGVALAAIHALADRVDAVEAENQALAFALESERAANAELRQTVANLADQADRLEMLEAVVQRLAETESKGRVVETTH